MIPAISEKELMNVLQAKPRYHEKQPMDGTNEWQALMNLELRL